MSFISPAFANTGAAGGFDFMSFAPMIGIFVLFYFLMIRPQQKRAKEHQKMLSEIQKGDEVITQGGILGRVVKTNEQYITVEITNGVEIHLQRAAISGKLEKGTMKSI